MAPQAQRRSKRLRSVVPRYTDDDFEVPALAGASSESELSRSKRDEAYDLSDEEFTINDNGEAKEARLSENGAGYQPGITVRG